MVSFPLQEPDMTLLSPFGERSSTVIAASVDDRKGAENAASAMLRETPALSGEVAIIRSGDTLANRNAMNSQTLTQSGAFANCAVHELRFTSLYDPGRGVSVPCDATGIVDLDSLTERLKNAYLGARAMIGREYAFPTVQRAH
jgi:hypothetical protein